MLQRRCEIAYMHFLSVIQSVRLPNKEKVVMAGVL